MLTRARLIGILSLTSFGILLQAHSAENLSKSIPFSDTIRAECTQDFLSVKMKHDELLRVHTDYEHAVSEREKLIAAAKSATQDLAQTFEKKIQPILSQKEFTQIIENQPNFLNAPRLAKEMIGPFDTFLTSDIMKVNNGDRKIPGFRTVEKFFYTWRNTDPNVWGITISRTIYPIASGIRVTSSAALCEGRKGYDGQGSNGNGWHYSRCFNQIRYPKELEKEGAPDPVIIVEVMLMHTSKGLTIETSNGTDEIPMPQAPTLAKKTWLDFLLENLRADCFKYNNFFSTEVRGQTEATDTLPKMQESRPTSPQGAERGHSGQLPQ